ncbi:cupin domain-containing protein [Aminobacter sp. HY435]|uniref:cupin domain-containing protein n=1 Tax=Aminobacter sp. HY435 TaxID=2970917 RepID=UPI0022B986A2|nr:cupin domain-containing protein [Aminobacter sp. HY435]
MTINAKTDSNGELLWFNGTLATIKVSGEAGADTISVIEHLMPYGSATPLHIHRNEDEVFHILEGVMRFNVEGKDFYGHAGQTLLAPKGIPHCYRVISAEGARCLTITTRGDFERMVREVSVPAERAEIPPQEMPTPEVIAALTEVCARNGIDIIGAPLTSDRP